MKKLTALLLAAVFAVMLPVSVFARQAESTGLVLPETIPQSFVTFNGHTYRVYYRNVSWDNAVAYCQSLGGHMATITSKAENDFLFSYTRSIGEYNVYFGLTNDNSTHTWQWVNGETSSYRNWHAGEPSNYYHEYYAMFFYQFDDGKWNDGAFCYGDTTDDTRTFLCEWDKLLGDANKDGKIDTEDALMVLRAALGITNNANTLRSNCDMDFSGKLDTTDALMILRMALGIN